MEISIEVIRPSLVSLCRYSWYILCALVSLGTLTTHSAFVTNIPVVSHLYGRRSGKNCEPGILPPAAYCRVGIDHINTDRWTRIIYAKIYPLFG